MATLAETVIQGAQVSQAQNGAGVALKDAVGAFDMAQKTQMQRQELDMKRQAFEATRQNSFLNSAMNITKLPKGAREYAAKNLRSQAEQNGYDPLIVDSIVQDEDFRRKFIAQNAKILSRGGITPEEAKQADALFRSADDMNAFLIQQGEMESKERQQQLALSASFQRQSNQQGFSESQAAKTRFTDYVKDANKSVESSFEPLRKKQVSLQGAKQAKDALEAGIKKGLPEKELEALQSVMERQIAMANNVGSLTDKDVEGITGAQGIVGKSKEWIRKNVTGGVNKDAITRLDKVINSAAKTIDVEAQKQAEQLAARFEVPEFAGRGAEIRAKSGLDAYLKPTLGGNSQTPMSLPQEGAKKKQNGFEYTFINGKWQ